MGLFLGDFMLVYKDKTFCKGKKYKKCKNCPDRFKQTDAKICKQLNLFYSITDEKCKETNK